MAATPMPFVKARFFDRFGKPLSGGKVYTYEPRSTTPKTTYTSANGDTPNTNPVLLNAAGEASIFLRGRYRVIVRTVDDVLVNDEEDVGSWYSDDLDSQLQSINEYLNAKGNIIAAAAQARIDEMFTAGLVGAGSTDGMVALLDGRTQRMKNAETASVKDFGALGDGITDDTTSLNAALADGRALYVPHGVYPFTGDIDALLKRTYGNGSIKYSGYLYPAQRKTAVNQLWQGHLSHWPMAHALGISATQRKQIPCGVTHARIGFVAEAAVYHVNGQYTPDAIRIQRNATTSSPNTHTMVINLTREETKRIAGNQHTLSFHVGAGSDFSGSDVGIRVQCSEEPEQPILSDNGNYTNGNQVLASMRVGLAARPHCTPHYLSFFVPTNATQVAVVFDIPFAGTALTNDYIEIEDIALVGGSTVAQVLSAAIGTVAQQAAMRYQTSYPYAAPRGTATEQGAVQAIATNTELNFALAVNVRFSPAMSAPPQFLFQSPISGTESRWLNKTTGLSVNGLAYNLSERGVTISNNAILTVGDRLLCHWTAEVLF